MLFLCPQDPSATTPSAKPRTLPSTQITTRERRGHTSASHPKPGQSVRTTHVSPLLRLLIHTHVASRAASLFSPQPSLSDSALPGRTETTSGGRRPRTLQSESGPRCGERWLVRHTVAPAPASAAEATHQTEPKVFHFLHSKARVCRA